MKAMSITLYDARIIITSLVGTTGLNIPYEQNDND